MIAYIQGKVWSKEEKNLIILLNGIGYKIFALSSLIEKSRLDQELEFWIHEHIREDAHDLYGFETRDERDFFGLLISISGVGPKSAMNILNIASIESLKKAASSGDISHLTKVSGIGRKIAEKIVLELKGKFNNEEESVSLKSEVEAVEALKSLGYSQKESRDALKAIPDSLTSTEDRIKAALKILGK